MTYIIKISDDSPQAKSILNMLKTLAEDYTFLEIIEETEELSPQQVKELDDRLEYVLRNPSKGKSWEDIEKAL